jgi:Tol biopolymer transport system component
MKILISALLIAAFQAAPAAESRIEVNAPPTTDPVSLAISPDGDKIVFVVDGDGKYQLWVHSLSSGTSRRLPGTTDVVLPFPCWSPDSRSIAFAGPNRLKRIDIETGEIKIVAQGAWGQGRGCSWSRDGTILFSAAVARPILRVSEEGGQVSPATAPGPVFHQSPHYLPDGRHFLTYAPGGGVYVGEAGAEPRHLLAADSAAVYSRSGHLLFVRKGALYGQAFDPGELKVSGDAFIVAQQVPVNSYVPAVSTSAAGYVVYRPGMGGNLRQFKWFDRAGKEIETVGDLMTVAAAPPQLSPDGKSVAIDRAQDGNGDIWLLELATGRLTRFTTDPSSDSFPIWSADGRTIYFTSNRTGRFELYEKPAAGDTDEKLAPGPRGPRVPRDLSRDGNFMLYIAAEQISAVHLAGDPPGDLPVVETRGANNPQFSPDGRWIAYDVNTNGRVEIFLQQFPSGRRIKVSMEGGARPRWRPDGKELFYIVPTGELVAMPVELAANGQDARTGTPSVLFTPNIVKNLAEAPYAQPHVVSPDGERFLIATVPEVRSPINVIRNWQPKP